MVVYLVHPAPALAMAPFNIMNMSFSKLFRSRALKVRPNNL